jgi:hypothetical protein
MAKSSRSSPPAAKKPAAKKPPAKKPAAKKPAAKKPAAKKPAAKKPAAKKPAAKKTRTPSPSLPGPPGLPYEARRERERARQAAQARAGQDIGPIPLCADPQRRRKAEASSEAWAQTYFPNRFFLPLAEDHREQFRGIDRIVASGGLQAIAAPRGDGKTTRLEVGILKAVMTGQHSYAVLICATMKRAPSLLSSIKMELLTNELLLQDYPEVCYPIRKMNNRANRCQGMTSEGRNLWPGASESQWGRTRIVLPCHLSPRETSNGGGVIETAGLLEAVRGLRYARPDGSVARPTLLLIDDPQTDRSARSPLQCEQREQAIAKGLLMLGPPDREISALAAVTVIEPGDLADRILDRQAHPAWHGVRKQMLYAFPSNLKLWDEYGDVFRAELTAGSEDFPQSRQFYLSNRGALDEGAVVAWEHRHPGCASAVEYAMRCFIKDRSSFMSELQNTPERGDDGTVSADTLTATQLCHRQGAYQRGEIPAAVRRLTWFCDVHAEILYWVVCGWAEGFTGWVVDYGTWPQQDAAYFDHRHLRHKISNQPGITATTREGRCLQGLDAFFAGLHAREWKRVDGIELRLELGLTDANDGAVTDAVYEACRAAGRKYGIRVVPSHGMPFGPAKCPISRYDRKANTGAVLGDEWMLPQPKKCRIVRHVVFDAGRRKSFMWRRLLTPIGDPGALVLYAAEPSRHRLLAEHLASEKGTKVSGPYGELIDWRLQPGQQNHWLDCLSGCCTAESMLGGRLKTAVDLKPMGTKPTKPKTAPKLRNAVTTIPI